MGVKGLFTYINRENIQGGIVDHTIDDILKDIRIYNDYHSKAPKILFHLRAFNNYYNEQLNDVIFGCRFNMIKESFETLLGSFKSAGAELVFTSKSSNVDKDEPKRWKSLNKEYESGKLFVEELQKFESINEIYKRYRKWHNYPWQDTSIIVLAQSAKKFGTFCENDCLSMIKSAGSVEKANDEDFYAICGLCTSYLLYPGSWKFYFPARMSVNPKEMMFKEYKKQVILTHLNFNLEQLQLLSVLNGKFYTSLENYKILDTYFLGGSKLNKIIDFVHEFAPAEKTPLQHDTINEILREIFGDNYENEDLKRDFAASLNFKSRIYHNGHSFDDIKVKLKLQSDPFSSIAECIFNKLPILILSPFLDVEDNDMEPLKELTIGWIQRTGGILFKDREVKWSWPIIHRLKSGDLERIDIEAEFPLQNIPEWKNLFNGNASMDDKYSTLAFLINYVIPVNDLKEIPLNYLAHVLITTHLVENDSMTIPEAIAMTKAMKRAMYNTTISRFNYPKKVNARLFRVSALYEKMYMILLGCFSATGLKDLIADLTLDNVLFQSIYNDMVGWSRGTENYTKENAFIKIMKIIKE